MRVINEAPRCHYPVEHPTSHDYHVMPGRIAVSKNSLTTLGLFTCVGFYVSQDGSNMLSHVNADSNPDSLVRCIRNNFDLDKPLTVILANATKDDCHPELIGCSSDTARNICLKAIQKIYSLESISLAKDNVDEYYDMQGDFMSSVTFSFGRAEVDEGYHLQGDFMSPVTFSFGRAEKESVEREHAAPKIVEKVPPNVRIFWKSMVLYTAYFGGLILKQDDKESVENVSSVFEKLRSIHETQPKSLMRDAKWRRVTEAKKRLIDDASDSETFEDNFGEEISQPKTW